MDFPETYWIVDHDELCWAPAVLLKDFSDTQMHVQCIVDEDYYAIEKPPISVSKVSLEGREDLLDLMATTSDDGLLGSVLHTLRQRHEQN